MTARKKNLDVYLQEIFKQFIAIKDDDFKKSQEIFKRVFDQIKQKMEEKCNFFSKFASQVTYGGSVSDGIKVGKLDEFDMDIVIRLPINYGDSEHGIIIENESPGFVKLKITNAFDHLDKQKEWESCNKVTRDWRDSDKYFLQNKFRHWLHSIIQKALNDLNGVVVVNELTYLLKYKASGPAYTLQIRNNIGDPDFVLDIDFVPVIRFMLPRWPNGYRLPEGHKCKEWFVVPKPNKAEQNDCIQNRCWRLSFQDFEREMIKDCKNLKMTIRLVKKLRDALGMSAIASYYIKTLFLWKIHRTNDKKYWETKISVLFREMALELYNAIKNKNIPYFWNEGNNLIDGLKPSLQTVYAEKLNSVLKCIAADEVERTVLYLLTTDEINEFKNSEFYKAMDKLDTKRQNSIASTTESNKSRESSVADTDASLSRENSGSDTTDISKTRENNENSALMKLVTNLMMKMEILSEKIEEQNERILKLEMKQRKDDIRTADLVDGNNCCIFLNNEMIDSNLNGEISMSKH